MKRIIFCILILLVVATGFFIKKAYDYESPPPGFAIVTDGGKYKFKWPTGTISVFEKSSWQSAVNWAWKCKKAEDEKNSKTWKEAYR